MLPPCPKTPNCVSTQATSGVHAIAPIPYRGTAEEALTRLAAVVASMRGATIVERGAGSLRAEFRTRLFRFVDDVLFEIDAERKTLEFRSASRIGHSDLGVNRKRMELIRSRFGQSESPA
ncbi:MAG: DUF1499 domain-containing protein [Acidobacteriota bacterium]